MLVKSFKSLDRHFFNRLIKSLFLSLCICYVEEFITYTGLLVRLSKFGFTRRVFDFECSKLSNYYYLFVNNLADVVIHTLYMC